MDQPALVLVLLLLSIALWVIVGAMLSFIVDSRVERLRGWQAWALILLPPLTLVVLVWLYLRSP